MVVAARSPRPARQLAARAFALACALTPVAGHAQSPKLEAAYVVLGPQGAVARAVIADATRCPPIAVDGGEQAMNVRARPDGRSRCWSANCRSQRGPNPHASQAARICRCPFSSRR